MVKKTKSIKTVLEAPVKEIAQGITVEKLDASFFDISKLKHQPEPLYRLDYRGYRLYYRFNPNKEPIFYNSVTTLIHNQMPTSKALQDWQKDHEESEMLERAAYGTFLHTMFQKLTITGKYDLGNLKVELEDYLIKEKMTMATPWETDLRKDILALAQFIIDYNVKPLAVEIILYHPTDGYAGALDLVCEMDYEEKGFFGEVYLSGANKGQPKETKRTIRINAILDLKSGKKGFYDSHVIQLGAYREMWNIHFKDVPITKTFNLSPKAWQSAPSYNLKEQTFGKASLKLPYFVSLQKVDDLDKEWTTLIMDGVIEPSKGLTGNISEKSLAQLVKENA